MRLGWFRPVHCKSLPAQETRALLTARKLLQAKLHDLEMSLRGILRGFGLKVGATTARTFEARIRALFNFERFSLPRKAGRSYFYLRNGGLQNQSALYVQGAEDKQGRLLIDPNGWSADGAVARRVDAEFLGQPVGDRSIVGSGAGKGLLRHAAAEGIADGAISLQLAEQRRPRHQITHTTKLPLRACSLNALAGRCSHGTEGLRNGPFRDK